MMGSRFSLISPGLGDAPFSHVGEKEEGTSANDVKLQAAKSRAMAEVVRLRQNAATNRARIAAGSSSTWSQWAPLLIVGGVAAVGIVTAVMRRRKTR